MRHSACAQVPADMSQSYMMAGSVGRNPLHTSPPQSQGLAQGLAQQGMQPVMQGTMPFAMMQQVSVWPLPALAASAV